MRMTYRSPMRPVLRFAAFIVALWAFMLPIARAHEIPTNVVVQAWLKADDDRLNLVVRVPLEAMRDIQFPQRGPGYPDIPAANSILRDAAQIWVAHDIDLYEEGTRLIGKKCSVGLSAIPSY